MVLDDDDSCYEIESENMCIVCSEEYLALQSWVKCRCPSCATCNSAEKASSSAGPCKNWAHEACTDDPAA